MKIYGGVRLQAHALIYAEVLYKLPLWIFFYCGIGFFGILDIFSTNIIFLYKYTIFYTNIFSFYGK